MPGAPDLSAVLTAALRRLLPLAVCIALVALSAPALAGNDEEAELLKVLKQETDIATKTRMNSDFVPGIVTILEGDRLRALGARTVWEGLEFVPGVQPTLDPSGTPSVVVRGIPFPFNSGNIQILLNGSPIAREAAGLDSSVLYLPTSQVERIEFIRGPGSVLYGDFAFQGLINIVTRKRGNEVGGGVTSHGERETNLLLSGQPHGIDAALNLAGSVSGDAILPTAFSGDETRFSGVASASYEGFSFLAQAVNRHLYAVSSTLPGGAPKQDETNWSTEARYQASLGRGVDVDARLQYLYNNLSNPGAEFKGKEIRSQIDLHWNGWSRQRWLAGIEYADAGIDRAARPFINPMAHIQPVPIFNRSRRIAGIYLQDQIALTPSLSATLGARYDDNSQVGTRLTPRAALVWRAAEHHIFKAQYSEGLRSPTFFELYGPELTGSPGVLNNLDFEVNHTGEINYVYERPQLTFRATAFDTRITNMIFLDRPPFLFGNVARAKAQGAEFELTQELGAALRIDANLSYVNSWDNRNVPAHVWRPIDSVPRWMGNLGVLWNPSADLVCSVRWNHVGTIQVGGGSGYDVADLSLRRSNLFDGAVDWEVGVNNLFDERVSYLVANPNGVIVAPYQDRIAWTRLIWHW